MIRSVTRWVAHAPLPPRLRLAMREVYRRFRRPSPASANVPRMVMRSTQWTATPTPRVLLYTPDVRGNPYQQLLYGALLDHGIAPIPCPQPDDLRHAALAVKAGGSAVAHLHWTAGIAPRAATEDEFRAAADGFTTMVGELQELGVTFLWTIHNRLPHDCRFPQAEAKLRAELASIADAIHVMSPLALDEVADLYPVDDRKVAAVPHPSYVGAYPDFASQLDSRFRLGIGPGEIVVAALGAVSPYKRLDQLHHACTAARAAGTPIRLIVAGEVRGSTAALEATLTQLRRDPWVVLRTGRLSDRELAEHARAADVVACTYDSPLVSGTSVLAMSLGRAVLLPDRPVSRELAGEAGVYVDLGRPTALATTITGLRADDLRGRGAVARERAEEWRGDIVAERFAALVDGLMTR